MNKKKQLRLKKIKLHPISTYIVLVLATIILSKILSLLNFRTTYSTVSAIDLSIIQNTVTVENLLSFEGLKEIISNATKNFISFAPLSTFLLMVIGISILEVSGCFNYFNKKIFSKVDNKIITFIIILLATISTIINDTGYTILIPLSAIIYKEKGRNPLSGIIAAFCGVAFGSGTTIFVGSTEVSLIPYTTGAARLVNPTYHVSLLSNLYIMIISSIVLAIVGTIIVEKIIVPKFGKMKASKELVVEDAIEVIDVSNEEDRLNEEYLEKRGVKYFLIASITMVIACIYCLIPKLPLSGLLLDMSETTYLKQLFGDNSYFQNGFTYMIFLLFVVSGIAYGIGSKKFKSDKDIFKLCHDNLKDLGGVIMLIFLASQFIAIFKKTNIGLVVTGIAANIIDSLNFSGIPLLIIAVVLIAISNLFFTSSSGKWEILAPVIIPPLMQSNISPQFLQFVFRMGDSITTGITPLSAFFVIFLAYMNIYNTDKEKSIGIFEAIKLITPYFVIISLTWLLLLIGWYIIGLPIGPNVSPLV